MIFAVALSGIGVLLGSGMPRNGSRQGKDVASLEAS
jgi:hypothetical protein